MKKNHKYFLMIVSVFLCLCLTATISAMQMGGFDIDVGNGENSSWQWQEEQWWNQSSWENTWENSWQTDSSTTENTTQNSHVQDNEYQSRYHCCHRHFKPVTQPQIDQPPENHFLCCRCNNSHPENHHKKGFSLCNPGHAILISCAADK